MPRIGLVTIGQAPRHDLAVEMFPATPGGPGLEFLHAGALDDLDPAGIDALAPRDGEVPLVTRLRDGREVVVDKQRLVPHLAGAVERVVGAGAGVVVILCTGDFPGLTARVPLVFPDRVVRGTVDALLPGGVLGVLMPHPGQATMMQRKWAAEGRELRCAAASPYTGPSELAACAAELRAAGAQLIVMDCMGYTAAMKEAVVRATGLPTIQANRLVGRIVEEVATA